MRTIDEAEPDPKARIKPFPIDLPYLAHLAKKLQEEHLLWVPKSRRLMLTWINCAYLVWRAMSGQGFHGFVQTKKEDDADWLIKERVWFVYQHLPGWLKFIAMRGQIDASYKFCKLTLPNGSKIWGVPQGADQFRGFTPSSVFIDEAAYHELFQESLTALLPLREKGCSLFFVSSAKPSYFGEVVLSPVAGEVRDVMRGMQEWTLERGGRVLRCHYTADPDKDPLRNGREWYENTVQDYPGGAAGPAWRQEMECDFGAYSGQLVYPEWTDSDPHVVEPFPIPVDAPRYRVLDYGRRNPTCCLWIAVIDDEWYVYREYYKTGKSAAEIKREIWELSQGESYKATWVDPSTDDIREQDTPSVFWLFRQPPHEMNPFKADRSAAGRWIVSEMLAANRLHVFAHCQNMRKEFKEYRYEDFGEAVQANRNLKESPMKKDDHAMDCIKMYANMIRGRHTGRLAVQTDVPRPQYGSPAWFRAKKALDKKYVGSGGLISVA